MAQDDFNLINQSGAQFRSDLNNQLAAIVSNSSGLTEPATTFAYQWWADTTLGVLKQRNAANTGWITIGTLADQNLGLALVIGSASQVFSVGTATAAAHAVRLDQVGRRVGQIVTSSTGIVATGTTVMLLDNTIPQNTEGDQYLSLAITPLSATSSLEIDIQLYGASSTAASNIAMALFQDTTANALSAGYISIPSINYSSHLHLKHVMTSGTTSATTFKVRAGTTSGTFTLNGFAGSQIFGGVIGSTITITEYLP